MMYLAEFDESAAGDNECGPRNISDIFSSMWVVIATYVAPTDPGAVLSLSA